MTAFSGSDFDAECFFITPLGPRDSAIRRRSDGVLKAVVQPAAEDHGLRAVRADEIADEGHITLQVIEHVCRARCAIADLTGGNLNVYYEVGLRHAARQPLVLIADESEDSRLPFDLLQQRTVFYSNDMEGAAGCRAEVANRLKKALEGTFDSPVDASLNLRHLREGDRVERTLGEVVTRLEALTASVQDRLEPGKGYGDVPATRADVASLVTHLVEVLPAQIVAHAVGLKDPRALGRYARREQIPRVEVENRLRQFFMVVEALRSRESDETVRAWLIGAHPLLEGQSPLEQLHDGKADEVLRYARSFAGQATLGEPAPADDEADL